jgi:glycosyltransferase involved in cell wall biosynthesis
MLAGIRPLFAFPGKKQAMAQTSDSPLVSVIIPTYNYAVYLPRAINSCLEQTYPNLEIIVVDDGSTDDTAAAAGAFEDRIIYVRQENQGVSAARNTGLGRARGEFVVFLDADDILLKDCIASTVAVLREHPDIGIVFTDTLHLEHDGRLVPRRRQYGKDRVSDRFYEDLLLRHLPFQTSGVTVRSSIATAISFPRHLSNGEDQVYFTKVFFMTKGYFLARPEVANYHHEDSLRHSVGGLIGQDTAFVDTILDDPFYEGKLEYMRKELTARRHLALFRRLYLSGESKAARKHYVRAVSMMPALFFKIDYLVKLLKSLFR